MSLDVGDYLAMVMALAAVLGIILLRRASRSDQNGPGAPDDRLKRL